MVHKMPAPYSRSRLPLPVTTTPSEHWSAVHQVLQGKHYRVASSPGHLDTWHLVCQVSKGVTVLAISTTLYLYVGIWVQLGMSLMGMWTHLFMNFVTAPIIACFFLLTKP